MTYQKIYHSPLGPIRMQSDDRYLTGLSFIRKEEIEKDSSYNEKELEIFVQTKEWLDLYFSGREPHFIPKYKIDNLTPFRKQVIDIMKQIPYGATTTYGDIAKKIARERGLNKMSTQAVGKAVGWNPICFIIPCHRVVGKNGNLVGYSGGIENKKKLLEIEKNTKEVV